MAKLTKTEIRAIAEQIQSEILKINREKTKEKNKEIEKAFYKTDIGKRIKFLQENTLTQGLLYSSRVETLMKKEYVKSSPTVEEIERAVIIEQISNPDIKNLISKIKSLYKLK